jgi:hypothetical protein
MKEALLNLIIMMMALNMAGQQTPDSASAQIMLVNRLHETKIKIIRSDKQVTIRMMDGRKIKGDFYLEDDHTMVIGSEKIRLDSIYSLSGFVIRNLTEKAMGAGLMVLSGAVVIYPLYLIIGGLGLGEAKALFAGITLLFFDIILAYAGSNLAGIYPRRFNMMNWRIRINYQSHYSVPFSKEIPLDMNI